MEEKLQEIIDLLREQVEICKEARRENQVLAAESLERLREVRQMEAEDRALRQANERACGRSL